MKEPYLNTSPMAYLHSDQNGLCWRMFKESSLFPAEEPALLDRLPAWGTICASELYEQAIPEVLINVRDGSALLGTPRAIKLLPTPSARDHKDYGENVNWERGKDRSILPGTIMSLRSEDGNKSSEEKPPNQPTTKG